MDFVFVPLAGAVGASVDQVKLISCLLISYPLGSVFIRIPSSRPDLKHIFNISVTLTYLVAILNLWSGFLQLLAGVLATYYVAANVKGPNMPWIVFAITMGHLTANHVIRALYSLSYETVEITGPQMVLTMKLTTFAWNVWDGRRRAEELDKWQLEKRVVQYPSLLEFLGYAFYFPGVLVGPYVEYANYMALINETIFKVAEKGQANDKTGRRVPKGRKRVAYRKMVTGLAYLGLFVTLGGSYNFAELIQDWFAQKSLLYRIAFFQFAGIFERCKYYAIWTLTEGASILTGLGFTGYGPSGETHWEGAANVDVVNIELCPNIKVMLDSWNMKTNVWLRECVYKRVTPQGKKPGFRSSMTTFATSAFWKLTGGVLLAQHGISGGYYLAFFLAGFVQTVGRLCRAHLRPLVLPATYVAARGAPPPPQTSIKIAYDVVGTICAVMMMNYVAAPFMLLSVKDSLHGWASVGWHGHWMIGGALVFFYAGGTGFLRKTQAKRVKKAGVQSTQPTTPGATDASLVLPPVDSAAKEVEKAAFVRSANE
ncbi:MBOAT, membrane-bound O-acyltransferase family-domain-containing protein [Amylocystis lapponica]|nr:MBOAT, membrane-bound O-acyltransferase family-domain-containing protein [Amylocystis lapponica]